MPREPLEQLPVISDEHLDAMRSVEKPLMDPAWRTRLLKTRPYGVYEKNRYPLRHRIDFGPARGSLFLFVRYVRIHPQNFSVGLGFIDEDAQAEYRLIRCNGFHSGRHRNWFEKSVIPADTPHVHIATRRYIEARDHFHDHYAEVTDAYGDINGAIEHLIVCANLSTQRTLSFP